MMDIVGNVSPLGFLLVAVPTLFLAIFFFAAVRTAKRSVEEEDLERDD